MNRYCLERKSTIERFSNVDDIVRSFTNAMSGVDTGKSTTDEADGETAKNAHNVVLYDDDTGDAMGVGKATMENIGFNVKIV